LVVFLYKIEREGNVAGQRLPGLKRGLNIVAEQRADGTSVVRKQIVR